MSAPARGGAFALVLIAVFALASLAGAKFSPGVDSPEHNGGAEMGTHETSGNSHEGDGGDATAAALPGLASAASGYRLIPGVTRFRTGDSEAVSFEIVASDGQVVRDFDTEHARKMHLIVVRRDFANFQHLHPRQGADGTWEAEADLSQAGVYRVFADFSVEGQSLTLAGDLFVAGAFEPEPLAPVSTRADAGDGYRVDLDSPAPEARSATPIRFRVSLDGEPLREVEPYLGADGHLVALREHDQAFLHTHPAGGPGGGGTISFQVHYPTPGRYRLFLQFKHQGKVRTAAFTQAADQAAGAGEHAAASSARELHREPVAG